MRSKKLLACAAALAFCALCSAAFAYPMTPSDVHYIPPTPSPVPTATPAPGPTSPPPQAPAVLAPVPEADPEQLGIRSSVIGDASYDLAMPAQDGYSALPGVLTFRGGPYRQNAAYGYATAPEHTLEILWQKNIGGLDNWGGVGWNGQAAVVQWPDALRGQMNLYDEKKAKEGLVEVIYGTLDGHIYFLDLDDGSATRDAIDIGFPIKGSVSVDPRGVPLLYCGQGISKLSNKSGKIGFRIFSLLTGETLLFANGLDDDAYRSHGAFDSVALVDPSSDVLIEGGENGMLYTFRLHTDYDAQAGTLSIDPERAVLRYKNGTTVGIENSVAVYDYYAYFADNGGFLLCVDVNTLSVVWAADVTDDTDATVALDPRPDGRVLLYTGCEVDKQKTGGRAYLRCFDALTGEKLWEYSEVCEYDEDVNGGLLGSPLVGTGPLDGMVFFHLAKVYEGGGALLAFDKDTGELLYRQHLPRYGWSSPVAIYGAEGEAHIILGDSGGVLRLIDPFSGETLSTLELEGNIEGSPVVFGDKLVIGTRGRYIYGVAIR